MYWIDYLLGGLLGSGGRWNGCCLIGNLIEKCDEWVFWEINIAD